MSTPVPKGDKRKCVFCGTGKVTREDVWPIWLASFFDERDGKRYWIADRGGKQHRQIAPEAIAKRVCKTCNNGWMSVIETEAKPLLIPMIEGKTVAIALSPDAQRTLGTWAMKTILMADFLYSVPTIPPAVYSRFFTDRHPPKNGTVWAAAYDGPKRRIASVVNPVRIQLSHAYNRDGVLVPTPTPLLHKATLGTMRVMHAIFQVVICPEAARPLRHPEEDKLLVRIWPPHDKSVVWPPFRQALSDAGFDALSGRWGGNFALSPAG